MKGGSSKKWRWKEKEAREVGVGQRSERVVGVGLSGMRNENGGLRKSRVSRGRESGVKKRVLVMPECMPNVYTTCTEGRQ